MSWQLTLRDRLTFWFVAIFGLPVAVILCMPWTSRTIAKIHPVVTGTVIARTPIVGGWYSGDTDFTIQIADSHGLVHAHIMNPHATRVPDQVRFHYSGDPTSQVYILDYEPMDMVVIELCVGLFFALAGVCSLIVLRLHYRGARRKAAEAAPRTAAGAYSAAFAKGPYRNLFTGDFESRVEALAALRQSKDLSAVPALIELLKDRDSRIREETAYTLESLGDARAVDPLIAALRDLDGNVRLKIARALGVLKDPKAVDPLIPHLRDPDNIVRVFAAHALARIGDQRALAALESALQNTRHEEARQAMESAIASLKK